MKSLHLPNRNSHKWILEHVSFRVPLSMLDFYPLIYIAWIHTSCIRLVSPNKESGINKYIEYYITLSSSERRIITKFYVITSIWIIPNEICNACSLILVTLCAVTTCSECARIRKFARILASDRRTIMKRSRIYCNRHIQRSRLANQ